MYWLYGTKKTAAPVIPWYVLGETTELSFSLVVEETDVSLDKTSLCCIQKAHAGWFQAKLSTQDRYMDIGCVLDPTCYLGHLAAGTHQVDFRITIPATAESKLHTIPIIVMHNDGAVWPNSTFCGSLDVDRLWAVDFQHQPLWQGAYGGCPNFDDGSICIKEQIETVTFDSTVQNYMVCRAVRDDEGNKTFTFTRTGVAIDEIFAVGIAKDVDTGELLTQGFITNTEWSWTPGKQLFLNYMSGGLTQTRPSTVDPSAFDILCGVAVTATKICFYVQWPALNLQPLYFVLDGMAIATDGAGTVYFYGGEYENGTLANVLYSLYVDEYGTVGAQVELTSGGTARRDHDLIYVDGKLYAWGGTDSGDNYLNELWEYDVATDTWTQLTSGGTARIGATSVEIDGVIYYVGGTNAGGNVTVIDAYTIATDTWSVPDTLPQDFIDIIENDEENEVGTQSLGTSATITLANVPESGEGELISGGLYDDKLFYLVNGEPDTVDYGGENEEIHTTFLYYDLLTSTWTTVDTTGGPGACKWGAIVGNYFYAYGRARDELYGPGSLWRFSLLSNTWTELTANENAQYRYYDSIDRSVFFTDGTRLYVWGAWDSGDTDYLDVFTPSTGAWSQIQTSVICARYNFPWVVKNGLLYVHGGKKISGGDRNEAYSRTVNLSSGTVGTFGPSIIGDGLDYGDRMSWYDEKYFLFDWQNYEFPHNKVFMFLENGQTVYTPLTYPQYATNTPIKYGYRAYIPTVSRAGDSFTISAWSWDMRPTAGYMVVVSIDYLHGGQIVYTTTYGDISQSQAWGWEPAGGWDIPTGGGGVIGTKYALRIWGVAGQVQVVIAGAPGSKSFYVGGGNAY